jgi:D-alanyl-D-alanine carboxypeptidase
MLLNHTSGLPEYFDNPRISRIIANDSRHHWTRAEVLAALKRAQFAPGTRFSYTNSNYVVLGGILERLTGMTIESYFQRMIATPARMASSTFAYRASRSDEFAHPYLQSQTGSLTDQFVPGLGIPTDYWGQVWTDGGLASTATDLARFGNALFNGRLVRPPTLALMTYMAPHDYGLGIYDQSTDGHRWLGHDGAYGGYESENWTDASRHVTIAVTTNINEPDNAPTAASQIIWRALVRAYDRTMTCRGCCAT